MSCYTAVLTSDNEVIIGSSKDPLAIVRMEDGKYRVFAQHGLFMYARPKTNIKPRKRPVFRLYARQTDRLDPPDAFDWS